MELELKSSKAYKVNVDEDAILDLFVDLGISRDAMEVDFDVHSYFTSNDGVLLIDIKEHITTEMSEKIEAMLDTEFKDNSEIASYELTESESKLPRVCIYFSYPIYNENEDEDY